MIAGMRSKVRGGPAPAVALTVLALVGAVAGTAIAAPDAATGVSKRKTKRIARQQVKRVLPIVERNIAEGAVTEDKLDTELSDELDAKQDACTPGAVLAYAQVDLDQSATFAAAPGFNCTGGAVTARRAATGDYEVGFANLAFDLSLDGVVVQVTPVLDGGGTMGGYGLTPAGDLHVQLHDDAGALVDGAFSVAVLDTGP